MATAICVSCGASKKQITSKCRSCGLDPRDDEDLLVRSVYLSVGRFEDEEQAARYRGELDEIAQVIAGGEPYEFDAVELARLEKKMRAFEQIRLSAVLWALFLWALPGLLLLAALWGIVFLLDAFL